MVELNDIRHGYGDVNVLNNLSLRVASGETCAILGASGSGKSTLLSILGLLEPLIAGEYCLDGENMMSCTSHQRAELRNRKLGFVFQHFHLLPRLNALDNVVLPLLYRAMPLAVSRRRAAAVLESLGMTPWLHAYPSMLSGGQRQRVAIARALVGAPSLLLADEPTGNLDTNTARDIISLLLELNCRKGLTMVMVTHDEHLAECLHQRWHMHGGKLIEAR
ncbi:putative ABC transport system ATP-binding protein|uniref:Putative ABC transport system ATP-binding protein n=1 Tax=Brenneria salicis ATCC 15712 = DSM 30166 TaxID=714314 RepID=A0A366I690_9GAMM|nr:ABC transporter ATP-binding protein [Brenneria salicis]NMN90039.1 putative ABC transport system ATP-binding protein [Brenneria salicis ATCC 15712 = DSM 30166]RBP64312.1 putative ABC transport system ATP-binding protein [Brenneria salicis ATCC 15712 = DSM 30166]RLM31464.1 ABC transporter ATP-binding protein [Brenneria salicis ATCC 15712 = DSM 30166]